MRFIMFLAVDCKPPRINWSRAKAILEVAAALGTLGELVSRHVFLK